MGAPAAELELLDRADGSASYSWQGYGVLAAVNGPVEAQRRDELPEEAAIDVIIRPAAGVAAIREKHFETLVHKVLRQVIRVQAHPRALIQVTLQVTSTPELDSFSGRLPQAASNLPLLPSLLNAALLALLTTSIPLDSTYGATFVLVDSQGSLKNETAPKAVQEALSVHAFCYNIDGAMLLCESEGSFELDHWQTAAAYGKTLCIGDAQGASQNDGAMDVDQAETSQISFIRQTIISRLEKREGWRQAG